MKPEVAETAVLESSCTLVNGLVVGFDSWLVLMCVAEKGRVMTDRRGSKYTQGGGRRQG